MTNRQDEVVNLANIPADIIRRIIRQERPFCVTDLCLISRQWNNFIKEFFAKRPLKPAIKCVKFSKQSDDLCGAKVLMTILSEHCEYFGGFEKDESGKLAHTHFSLMRKVNSRKVLDPRISDMIWRSSRVNRIEIALPSFNSVQVDAIRDCLANIPVRSLVVGPLDTFDWRAQRACADLIRARSVKKLTIFANLFPFGVLQFITDAMKLVEALKVFELYPTARHRLHFGCTKEDVLNLMHHLRVNRYVDAELLTRRDQQLRNYGPKYRSLIRVRPSIEISDSE